MILRYKLLTQFTQDERKKKFAHGNQTITVRSERFAKQNVSNYMNGLNEIVWFDTPHSVHGECLQSKCIEPSPRSAHYIAFLFLIIFFNIIFFSAHALNILIVGSGAREHALTWKCAQSPIVEKIFVAPGNAGSSQEPKTHNIAIEATDVETLVQFAQQEEIDLTIVGPENALAAGIVDAFTQYNLRCFGPTQTAAQLESSKIYAKEFMKRHHIPTAAYETFSDFANAQKYICQQEKYPLVIKADGLAAGKGVIIAHTQQEALDAAYQMLVEKKFGDASNNIIIEEFLNGKEITFMVITDGTTIIPLPITQDHKKRDDNDRGPNTGGMGAYCPVSFVTDELKYHIMHTIIEPTIRGMSQEGNIYRGFLYAGLMLLPNGDIKVLEYNCRLGDPEAQVVLMQLQSDLPQLCLDVLDNKLENRHISWDPRCALNVILASDGYPDMIRKKNCTINGLSEKFPEDIKIFHAGTKFDQHRIVTHGGRVLCVTALGNTLQQARQKVYAAIAKISFEQMVFRTDIGKDGFITNSTINIRNNNFKKQQKFTAEFDCSMLRSALNLNYDEENFEKTGGNNLH